MALRLTFEDMTDSEFELVTVRFRPSSPEKMPSKTIQNVSPKTAVRWVCREEGVAESAAYHVEAKSGRETTIFSRPYPAE